MMGDWVIDNSRGLSFQICSMTACCVCNVNMVRPHCWVAKPMTLGHPDPAWSPPHGQGEGCCH